MVLPDPSAKDHARFLSEAPRAAAGPWLKVSQNAGALKLQFADGTNVDGTADWASTAGEASTKGESAIIEASALASRALAL